VEHLSNVVRTRMGSFVGDLSDIMAGEIDYLVLG